MASSGWKQHLPLLLGVGEQKCTLKKTGAPGALGTLGALVNRTVILVSPKVTTRNTLKGFSTFLAASTCHQGCG